MATNQSVKRFQQVMEALPAQVKGEIRTATFDVAERVAQWMLFNAPRGERGALRESIRVEQGRNELRALIKAGGPLTTKGGYDYALGIEFGTEKMPAQPFFWPSWRDRRRDARRTMKKAAIAAIGKRVKLR